MFRSLAGSKIWFSSCGMVLLIKDKKSYGVF
jgi:hypothetical protein